MVFFIIDYYYTDQDTILDTHELYFYSELIGGWEFPEDTIKIKNDVDNLHYNVSIYNDIGGELLWHYPEIVNPSGYISYSNSDTLGLLHNIDIPFYVSFGSTLEDENITWVDRDGLHYFLSIDQSYSPVYINYIPPLLLSILFMIILNLFIRKFLYPIQLIKRRINALKEGDLTSTIKIVSNDELAALSESINKMILDIKSLLAQKQKLLLDVSHELRSPLARMRLIIEMIPEHNKKQKMIEEIIYLEGMISNLLLSDKLSMPYSNLKIEKIKTQHLIDMVLDLSNVKLENISVVNNIKNKSILVDKTKIIVALKNLIDNANKYGVIGTTQICFSQKQKDTIIEISNKVVNFNNNNLDKIFLPFYRMPNTINKISGFGLGLTICKKIIEAHDGIIAVFFNKDIIIFKITLPTKNYVK